jgi:hypothetical protein
MQRARFRRSTATVAGQPSSEAPRRTAGQLRCMTTPPGSSTLMASLIRPRGTGPPPRSSGAAQQRTKPAPTTSDGWGSPRGRWAIGHRRPHTGPIAPAERLSQSDNDLDAGEELGRAFESTVDKHRGHRLIVDQAVDVKPLDRLVSVHRTTVTCGLSTFGRPKVSGSADRW